MKEKKKIMILALIELRTVTPLKLKVMTEMMIMMIVMMRKRMMIVIRMMILVTTVKNKLKKLTMIIEKKMW